MIFSMALREFESTSSFRTLIFHFLVAGSMRLDTGKAVIGRVGSLGVGMKPSNQGTQGSFHMSIEEPSPTTKQAPFLTTSLSFSIALHWGEAFLQGSPPNQLACTLYLLLKALTHRLSLPEAIHQVNLANKALLKFFDSLNPNPPASIG